MESVLPQVIDNISRLCDCAATRIRYLCKLQENLNTLRTKMEELKRLRDDVKRRVDIAEGQLMTRTHQVDGWLQDVEDMQRDVEAILHEGSQHIQRRCLRGCCPNNCWSNYKLGKKVAKKLPDVEELNNKGDNFKDVAERLPPASGQQQPSRPTVGMKVMFDKVWSLLGEEHVGTMGIYGMGGVGKTTLLTIINDEFIKGTRDRYDAVIWIVVSKDTNVEKVQKDISAKLGLPWDENVIQNTRAAEIFRVLSGKKFVLLLDDIWESVDLQTVGIPLPDNQNKSKVVFTTRSEDVCGHMEAHSKFKVECLKWEEAWDLFRKKVGEEALSCHPEIPKLAEIVAKECDGLPLALITIGRAMASKKTPHEWNHAITILKKSASEFSGMGDKVFPLLKFSYDNLRDDTVRSCFLYCSLGSENFILHKELLIKYWIGEGLIDGFDDMNEARNRGHDIIGNLLAACLLERVHNSNKFYKDTHVKMHDVIRDLAIWIASECGRKKGKFLVQASLGLSEAPEVEKWEEAQRICLMDNKIKELRGTPRCPHLLTLILRFNPLNRVTNGFFQFMPAIRVLDLSFTKIEELPIEITKLAELRHLYLRSSNIKTLPKELGNLVNLNHLDLDFTGSLVRIPREALVGLSRLQALNIFPSSFGDWEVKGCCGDESEAQASLGDLERLKSLNTLKITMTTTLSLQRIFRSHMLQKCTRSLCIKHCQGLTSLPLSSSTLGNMKGLYNFQLQECSDLEELSIDAGENVSPLTINMLHFIDLPNLNIRREEGLLLHLYFQNLRFVIIEGCDALKDLTWLLRVWSLQFLEVNNCKGIEEVICCGVATMGEELRIFSRLEKLWVSDLSELKSICEHALPFPFLREIKVKNCPKLKKLPLDSNSAKNTLEEITGSQEWWEELEWEEDETIKSTFIPNFRQWGKSYDAGNED